MDLLGATAAQVRSGQRLHLTTLERAGTSVVLLALAAAAALLGSYGLRRGAAMLPRTVAPHQVPHRVAVLRRGSIACLVAAVFVLAAAVVVALY